jgi:hypothetical protein
MVAAVLEKTLTSVPPQRAGVSLQYPNLEIGTNFRVFARGQGATLRGSGALEMIVDGTEKPLGQKEPRLTSPSLL